MNKLTITAATAFVVAANAMADSVSFAKEEMDYHLGLAEAKVEYSITEDPSLQGEDAVVEIKDGKVSIRGGAENGCVYGVYSFLEKELGVRWFDQESDPYVPKKGTPAFEDKSWIERPALPYRDILCSGAARHDDSRDRLFFFRNRINQIDNNYRNVREDLKGKLKPRIIEISPGCHSLFTYMPPEPKEKRSGWYHSDRDEGYFEEHSEWYSMFGGKRVASKQLCFSNPDLRAQLTTNFFDRVKKFGGKGFFDLSAQDVPGVLCECPECLKLTKAHQSAGAPLFDFLRELGPKVKAEYPEVIIHFLVYRREQTQRAPVGMLDWPDNLAATFAPIDNDFSKDYFHPHNRDVLEDFLKWRRLVKVWTWYYPYTYGGEGFRAGFARTAADTRLMIEGGLTGSYYEHDVGTYTGISFADAMTWMLTQLYRDPLQDWRKLRKEWFDWAYGPASSDMIAISDELEDVYDKSITYLMWNAGFPKLPPGQLVKLDSLFEKAESKFEGLGEESGTWLRHVREARYALDMMLISNRKRLGSFGAEFDYEAIAKRAEESITSACLARYTGTRNGVFGKAYAQGLIKKSVDGIRHKLQLSSLTPKPLPAQFDGIPRERIVEIFMPQIQKTTKGKYYWEETQDAAIGKAIVEKDEKLPSVATNGYAAGFYDAANRKFVLNHVIKSEEVVRDKFTVYKIGTVPMPNEQCMVWLGRSWMLGFSTAACYEPGTDEQWDLYAEIRIGSDDSVAVSRIICVR